MPTRKQRRRREKEFRHEYVWEDAEGNELDPEEVRGGGKRDPEPRRAARRPAREPQAPSWRRTLKRGAIFAPIMLGFVMLLSPNLTFAQQATQAALIAVVFVPFSYFLDGVFYRSYKKRLARQTQAGRRGS